MEVNMSRGQRETQADFYQEHIVITSGTEGMIRKTTADCEKQAKEFRLCTKSGNGLQEFDFSFCWEGRGQ